MVTSVGQVGLPPINVNTLGYQGSPLPYIPVVVASRDPTGADINYVTGCEWSNGITLDIWKLYGFIDGVAQWRLLASGGGGGGIQTLSDDFGTKAVPDGTGDIQQLGSVGIKTLAGATSINFSLVGDGIAGQYVNVDVATAPGVDPVVPDAGGLMNFTGGQVGPVDVGVNVIRTHSYQASTITFEIQQTDATAAKDTSTNGVAHFNSAQFTADEGFISLIGGSVTPAFHGVVVDDSTPPGTNPVVADGSGLLTVTGSQVAQGFVGSNVIRTDSLAPNTITVEVQRADATVTSDPTFNGVCHFDSAQFNVDVDGWVQLAGAPSGVTEIEVDASTPPGTNPVIPDVMGKVTVNGDLVAAGTTPIQTNSVLANQYEVEVQISQAVAATNITNNGMSHYYNDHFLVDANGFVTLKNPPVIIDLQTYQTDVIDDFAPPFTNLMLYPLIGYGFRLNSIDGSASLYEIANHPGFYSNGQIGGVGNQASIFLGVNGGTSGSALTYGGIALAPNGVTQIDMIHAFLNSPQLAGVTVDKWNLGYVAASVSGNIVANGNRYVCFTLVYDHGLALVRLFARIGTSAGSLYFDLGVTPDTDWHKYTIIIDSNVANTADFYYDDVLLQSISNALITGMASGLGINIESPLVSGFDLYRYQFTGYGTRY